MKAAEKKIEVIHTNPHIARWIRPFRQNPAFLFMMLARVTQGDNRLILSDSIGTQPLIETYGDLLFNDTVRHVSEDDANAFCIRLINRGHMGVLEHVQTSFHIVCSRACSHQIVRHRLASYLQVSQRHVVANTFIRYCHDKEDRQTRTDMKRIEANAVGAYGRMLARGVPKELARMVIPQTAATHLIMTANLRAWRHFLAIRMDKTAQDEVRYLANDIFEFLRLWFPPIACNLSNDEEGQKE